MPWYLSIPIAIVAIAIAVYLGNCFYEIACMKGFQDRRYFWIPVLFGAAGYLLVVALPDRKQKVEEPKPVMPLIKPTESVKGKWACPECGNVLPGDVVRCKCGYKR